MGILWKIFGNDDDPEAPLWFVNGHCKGKDSTWCKLKWYIRNPLHNLTFYLIGLKGKDFVDVPDSALYKEGGGWKYSYRLYGGKKYPLISYASHGNVMCGINFYIGWRPWSGAFGLTFRYTKQACE